MQNLLRQLLRILKYTGENVGTIRIRSSYVSYLNENKRLSLKDKKKLANSMRTSTRYLDQSYNNFLQNTRPNIPLEDIKLPIKEKK